MDGKGKASNSHLHSTWGVGMTTRQAIALLAGQLTDELVVCTTGHTCRDMQACLDRPENFYMIGSMGLASALGLGVALCRPDRTVVVLDGDGSVLMALGTLPMVGTLRPVRFVHVVLDNETYASTGGQPTYSASVDLDALAVASGYPVVRRVDDPQRLLAVWREIRSLDGPVFLLVKCRTDEGPPSPRVALDPQAIARRFQGCMGTLAA
jgi:thiamine pyrophosphate-dependent acetolactate synthase large subunit-like protein